jgi:SAM-dependent MidA family methyltransferase
LFLPIAGKEVPNSVIPQPLRDAAPGAIIETSPAGVAVVRTLAQRLVAQGGAAILVDYGYQGPALGETLQAVRGHAYANPFDAPGEQDLTAHVDFATVLAAAAAEGASVQGPVDQGLLLTALGIDARLAALSRAAPDRAEALLAGRNRLVQRDQMGTPFKAVAITAPGWPAPGGFA